MASVQRGESRTTRARGRSREAAERAVQLSKNTVGPWESIQGNSIPSWVDEVQSARCKAEHREHDDD